MLVLHRRTDNPNVEGPLGWFARRKIRAARFVAKRLGRMGAVEAPEMMRSLGMLSSGVGAAVARERADIIHLHWVGGEMMSLSEMAKLPSPTVWTCHDMWPFCGAEHYSASRRFVEGYKPATRTDVDAIIFQRKLKFWRNWRPTLVCPSNWLAGEAAASMLMRQKPRAVIPNTLDVEVFRPCDRAEARRRFGLPADGHMILFGAASGRADPIKGFDLLEAAISRLPGLTSGDFFLATFGSRNSGRSHVAGLPAYDIGRLRDPERLAMLYSAADVFVAPSRMDNLPNTLLEAQACGLPCVAFDIGGMRDIIAAPEHGALVPSFNVDVLAQEIISVIVNANDTRLAAIRRGAVRRFGHEKVVTQHIELYRHALEQAKINSQ